MAFQSLEVVISFFLVAEKTLIWESHPADAGPSQVLAAWELTWVTVAVMEVW